MTGKEAFKVWAPIGAKWVDWVRPVPFVQINEKRKINLNKNFVTSEINYINKLQMDTAIILDLPDFESIKEGIELAKIGIRPIPLYNGTNGQEGAVSLVDNKNIEDELILGAYELEKIKLEDNAPPVFLLDSNRMHRYKVNVSVFDNSWDIYDQDIPSAEYFLKNGINKIIIKGQKINKDLKKIFRKFKKKGITILFSKC